MELTTNLPPPNDLIPYGIIVLNIFIFKLLRSFTSKMVDYFSHEDKSNKQKKQIDNKWKFLKLLINELISTCELCADCFELNVVYEKHGSLAYGVVLFLLTYLWIDTFGDAHTTPGYLIEDYFLFKGNQLFRMGDTYARFLGQSLAMPLAYRFASLYWSYKLLLEHRELLAIENCKSSLTTNTINGFMIELSCCFICRLIELINQKLLDKKYLNEKFSNIMNSFVSTLLVVIALDLSGGYFNPILASSLEFSCKGPNFYEHVLVFWFGPLIGHVIARHLFTRYLSDIVQLSQSNKQRQSNKTNRSTTQTINDLSQVNNNIRRSTRKNSINSKKYN